MRFCTNRDRLARLLLRGVGGKGTRALRDAKCQRIKQVRQEPSRRLSIQARRPKPYNVKSRGSSALCLLRASKSGFDWLPLGKTIQGDADYKAAPFGKRRRREFSARDVVPYGENRTGFKSRRFLKGDSFFFSDHALILTSKGFSQVAVSRYLGT